MTDEVVPTEGKGRSRRHWSRKAKVLSAMAGVVAAGSTAFAASNWVVGLAGGSTGEAQSAAVSNLAITAVSTPAAGHLLYPGGTGDVVVTITNPNPFPVTVTGVDLPANTVFAGGFTDSALTASKAGCTSSTSLVSWNFSTGTSGTAHTFTTPLTVAAAGTLVVTLTNDAFMDPTAPAACENTFFSMPSLIGVAASGAAATATPGPTTTDAWTA